jgi:hypothetical protein
MMSPIARLQSEFKLSFPKAIHVVVDPVAIGTAITIAGGVFNITTKVIDITKFLKKEDKPYLTLDPERNTRRVGIHINNEDRRYKIPYAVYRVYIKNVGQIAAEIA